MLNSFPKRPSTNSPHMRCWFVWMNKHFAWFIKFQRKTFMIWGSWLKRSSFLSLPKSWVERLKKSSGSLLKSLGISFNCFKNFTNNQRRTLMRVRFGRLKRCLGIDFVKSSGMSLEGSLRTRCLNTILNGGMRPCDMPQSKRLFSFVSKKATNWRRIKCCRFCKN